MLNRRKAVIGYLVYTAAKPLVKNAVKDKAKKVKPGTNGGRRAPKIAAIVAGAGAATGAVVFWRRRGGDGEGPDSSEVPESTESTESTSDS